MHCNLICLGFLERQLHDLIMPFSDNPRAVLPETLEHPIMEFQYGPMDILDMANGTKFRAIAKVRLRWYCEDVGFDPKVYWTEFCVSESREARFDVIIGSKTCAEEGLLTLNLPVGLPGFLSIRRDTPGPVPSEYHILHISAFAQTLI